MKCIQVAVLLGILLAVSVFAEITLGVEVSGNSSTEGEFQKAKPEVILLWERMTDTSLGFRDRYSAAEQLLAQEDEQAVRRLVYGLKTGDIFSAQILIDHAPLSALPYMVEDIDHGPQTKIIGADDPGDVCYPSVRNFTTQIALKSLASSKVLPELTRRYFNHISEINYQRPGYFNDEFAEIIVGWWFHNKESLMARRYGEATWVPDELPTFQERVENPNPSPPPQPPTLAELAAPGKEIVLDETFEQWVDRVAVRREIRIINYRESHLVNRTENNHRSNHNGDSHDSHVVGSSPRKDVDGMPRWDNLALALAVIIFIFVAVLVYRVFRNR